MANSNVTRDDGTVEMPEQRFDDLKAALSEAEDKAEDADDLRAALEDAESERDDLRDDVDAMSPLVDTLRTAFAKRSALADDFVSEMSPDDIEAAYDGDLDDLLAAEDADADGDSEGEGGADEAPDADDVGSSGEGVSQTGAVESQDGGLTEDEQAQVAALESKAEQADDMSNGNDGWAAAADAARAEASRIRGDE